MSGKRNKDVNGIYLIVNLLNGKVYVGESSRIYGRWWEHRSALKHNKHKNQHLQSSWNLYGKEFFKFYIIEETIGYNSKQRKAKEDYYIDIHNSESPEFGYNIELAEEKNIQKNKKRVLKPKVYRKVYQICPINNTLIKVWDKRKDVVFYLNITDKTMERSFWRVSGYKRVITYKGSIWVRERDYDSNKDYRLEANKPPKRVKKEKPPKVYKLKEDYIRHNEKSINLQNIETKEVRNFKSYTEVKRQLGFNVIHLVKGYKIKRGRKAVITQWKGWKIYNPVLGIAHI